MKLLGKPKAAGRWTTRWLEGGRRELFVSPYGEAFVLAPEGYAADLEASFGKPGLGPLRLKRFDLAKWERKQARKARQRERRATK